MMSSFLPYVILSCMLCKTVVTQVLVSSNGYPTNGETITLTCSITSFTLLSSWINDTSSGILSTCLRTGTCVPTTSGRYSYSATNSTIVAQISAFDALLDNFGWKCRHDTDTHVFKFTFTTIPSSSGPASAIPRVTLTASSSPYFDIGGSISLTCSISEDVYINFAYLTKDREQYVFIQIISPSNCGISPLTDPDPHVYSVSCEQRMTVHIVMNRTVAADHNATWSCQMLAQSGICNQQPCISTSSVTTALRVPVSSVQLTDGNGQLLVTPVAVVDGSSKVFRCDTSTNGSRPRAFFNWYKRSENQSPILIQGQSVSTPGPKPEVDLSMSISYSTLALMGSRSYQNMYIFCEARDETNRGNFLKSTEAELNIVYPPVVKLYPNISVFNVTEGLSKFVFICNVTDANPMPDNYSWFHGRSVIQGQTRSSYELLNVQKSQNGVYQCMARNKYGTGNSSTMYLNVQYGPTISLIDYTEVEEGENVSIACNVIANPQPDIVWSRNGTVILPSSDTLRIPYISRFNDGYYTCTASNVLYPTGQAPVSLMATDTLRIRVLCSPMLDHLKNISTVYYRSLNDNVTLDVNVIAYPEPTDITWYHRGDKTDKWQQVPNQPTSSSGLFSSITVHLGSLADFGDYLVNMTNSFGIFDLFFQVIQKSPPQIVDIFCISRFMVNEIEFCFKPGFNGGSVQRFAIEYKPTASPDLPWKNSSVTDLKETQTHMGTYYVNVSHPPPGNYEYRMNSWNDIGRSPYSLVITVFIPADTRENRSEITLIVSSVLFGLAACLFIAALVLFVRSGKCICIGCKNDTSKPDPKINDIHLCQPRDNDGVSNVQAYNGSDYHYEDLNATSPSANEYDELSKGPEIQSKRGKHLYGNVINTSTM